VNKDEALKIALTALVESLPDVGTSTLQMIGNRGDFVKSIIHERIDKHKRAIRLVNLALMGEQ
jgi:hypothetical protein